MKNSARRNASATRERRPTTRCNIYARPIPELTINQVVSRALAEDVGSGDVTTAATVAVTARAGALISQKAAGVIYGLDVATQTFRALDADIAVDRLVQEGLWRESGPVLAPSRARRERF